MQFYATLFISRQGDMTYMCMNQRYCLSFMEFATQLGLDFEDSGRKRIHQQKISSHDLSCLYNPGEMQVLGNTKGLTFFPATLNKMFMHTIAPKCDDPTHIREFDKDLLVCMVKKEEFLVTDFIFQTMKIASADHTRSLPYAPYIMTIIDKIPQRVRAESGHKPFRPPTAALVLATTSAPKALAESSKKRKTPEAEVPDASTKKRTEEPHLENPLSELNSKFDTLLDLLKEQKSASQRNEHNIKILQKRQKKIMTALALEDSEEES